LAAKTYNGEPVRVILDTRDLRGGEKTWQHIKRGVPLRLEIGPRDVAGDSLFVGRRDTQEKKSVPRGEFIDTIDQRLSEIQSALFNRALAMREENTREINNRDDFVRYLTPKNEDAPEIHGGFALAHVAENDPAVDELLKNLKVTIRCLPVSGEIGSGGDGQCIFTGKSARRVVLAKAY
jgi:prolyl-tRNA synthetase